MIESCLQKVQLKNFRCFKAVTLNLDSPLVLIYGNNGTGKTSLLEALYYSCYLRSFRTHSPRDLVKFGTDGFFIKTQFDNQEISVGYSSKKRHIKINQKTITSYKELRDWYRIITVTEDDVGLIKESPERRRTFLNHAVLLVQPTLLEAFKTVKIILEQRNALLQKERFDEEQLIIWTKKLWEHTRIIQEARVTFITTLQESITRLIHDEWNDAYTLSLTYEPKKMKADHTWEDFLTLWKQEIRSQELRFKRSLFGAHLDDMKILFNEKPARLYSSRGQQKLIIMLIKIAQVKYLLATEGKTTFLLDDFLTDFDQTIMKQIVSVCIKLKTQLIFTSPAGTGLESDFLKSKGAHELNLTI